jgi:hypothetical protein
MKLKQLKVRPKKILEASPCIVEMGALFECWATAGVNDGRCTAAAQSLTNCMQKPVRIIKYNQYKMFTLVIIVGNQEEAYQYNQLSLGQIKQTIISNCTVYHILIEINHSQTTKRTRPPFIYLYTAYHLFFIYICVCAYM